jgi:Ca-activated chloride channel family protein
VKRFAAIFVILLLAGAAGTAESPPRQEPQVPVFRSGASLVSLSVTVTGPDKHFVTGLQASDFSVFEDGVQQVVQFFESESVPIDLIILLDASSSMRHRMEMVQDAALGFVDTLRERDRAAVVGFNDAVSVVQPLTADRALLERAIRGTAAKGSTALHNALYVALKEFGRNARVSGSIRRQALAVLSDGDDTSSLISFEDVLELAQKSGVTIYPIALTSDTDPRSPSGARYFSESQYAMRKLAQETGAQAFFPSNVRELPEIYAIIAEELSHQYSIGYAPRDARVDGRFRRVVVRVTTRPDLRPRTRMGYIAGAPAATVESPGAVR